MTVSVRSGEITQGVTMLGLPITMLGLQIETLGELVAAIGAAILLVTLLLTLLWMLVLLLWKLLNWLRPFRVLGGRYAINIISDPPGNGCEGIGDIIRSRIGDEVLFARKGARTFEDVDSPDALVPSQIPPLPDQVKGLAPIVNILLRRDRFVVTVTALKPVRKEVALRSYSAGGEGWG